MNPTTVRDLLNPEAIARGESLGILARMVVEGYRVGEHRSPYRGFAIEFAQHREYTIGDDTRHLDWKVLGRTDRYYIKQYEQDTNFVARLILDGSESMNYGSGSITKLHYAKVLAACVAHLVLLQRDAVALHVFDTELRETLAPTDSLEKIAPILNRLAAFQATEKTKLGTVLNDVAVLNRARGIVMIFSDLFDDEAALEQGVQKLRFGGSEVIIFHVIDKAELEFQFQGMMEFIGLEGIAPIKANPAGIRKSYLKAIHDFCQRVRGICDRTGSHYVLANTGLPLEEMLGGYLAFRRSLGAWK